MRSLKQVLVTGVSSEIGSVLAKELAADEGARIIGTMRRKRTADDVFPGNVEILDECDLTLERSCQDVQAAVRARFVGPFGFIHSVGDFWDHIPFIKNTAKGRDRLFASHVSTLCNTVQALIPVMQEGGGGSCVAFSCNSVRYNYPWMASFTAAKSAVDSIVRSLAHEFAEDGIRMNSLVLASVQTEKVRLSKPHGDWGRFLSAADLLPVIRFLLSEDAQWVSGNNINLFRYSNTFYGMGYFERVAK